MFLDFREIASPWGKEDRQMKEEPGETQWWKESDSLRFKSHLPPPGNVTLNLLQPFFLAAVEA